MNPHRFFGVGSVVRLVGGSWTREERGSHVRVIATSLKTGLPIVKIHGTERILGDNTYEVVETGSATDKEKSMTEKKFRPIRPEFIKVGDRVRATSRAVPDNFAEFTVVGVTPVGVESRDNFFGTALNAFEQEIPGLPTEPGLYTVKGMVPNMFTTYEVDKYGKLHNLGRPGRTHEDSANHIATLTYELVRLVPEA